jgi:uncharacterized protein (TIGR02452 family)
MYFYVGKAAVNIVQMQYHFSHHSSRIRFSHTIYMPAKTWESIFEPWEPTRRPRYRRRSFSSPDRRPFEVIEVRTVVYPADASRGRGGQHRRHDNGRHEGRLLQHRPITPSEWGSGGRGGGEGRLYYDASRRGRPERFGSFDADGIPGRQYDYGPGYDPARLSDREYFTRIADQNRAYFRNLINGDPEMGRRLLAGQKYEWTEALERPTERNIIPQTPIIVAPIDSLDIAYQLKAEGKRFIAVLNMANGRTAGGSYLIGSGAQEESLCRRSSLYVSIGPEHGYHPIPPTGAIYSPHVLVLRKSDEQRCELLPESEQWGVSVVSVAAVFRPPLAFFTDDFANREDKESTKDRIRTILRVCAEQKRKNLVLSALGCGAFKNPPKAVAKLFKEVFAESEFYGWFEGIWFAIMDRQGSQNYDIFRDVLHGLSIRSSGLRRT